MIRLRFSRKTFSADLPFLVYFLALTVYFSIFDDYVLFFQEKTSLFIFSRDFLIENLKIPGGMIIYLGKFFTAFFYIPFTGGVIISGFHTLIIYILCRITKLLSGEKIMIIPYLVGISLFWLQTDYRFPFYYTLGIFFSLISACLYLKYYRRVNILILIIVIPLLYFLTGFFTWIFILFLVFYNIFYYQSDRLLRICAVLTSGLLILYLSKEYIFYFTLKTLLIHPLAEKDLNAEIYIFLVIGSIISVLPGLLRIRLSHLTGAISGRDSVLSISNVLFFILIILIAILRYDDKRKQYFYVEKLFYKGKYNEIIDYNLKKQPTNSLTIFLNNISLCEKNKLDDLLFNFRQDPGGKTLFLKWTMDREVLRRGAYFYYAIGMINEAHRWAYENMVMEGFTPENLKMLIKTEILTSDYRIAEKYISILCRTIFYRRDALYYRHLLYNEKAIESDPELEEKRGLMVKKDFMIITDNPVINLERILKHDSLNIKAYEYMLASLLIKKDTKEITGNLSKLKKNGFKKIPIHIQEAAVAYSILKTGNANDLISKGIDKKSIDGFLDYLKIFRKYNSDPKLAEPELREKFGNTFWYYSFYR